MDVERDESAARIVISKMVITRLAGMVLFLYGLIDHAERHAPQNQIHFVA